ncbi:MAG: hypothetical protein WBN75_16410 [Verrucomicrobiia bacterium]
MLTIQFNIETNLKDKRTISCVAGGAVARHLTGLLKDIKDPVTGESPQVLMSPHEEGIKLSLRGSASTLAEAEVQIRAMLESE